MTCQILVVSCNFVKPILEINLGVLILAIITINNIQKKDMSMLGIFNKAHHAISFLLKTIFEQIDKNDELVQLADKIDWYGIGQKLQGCFKECGRQALPIRLMVGLLIIKYMYNLSDEKVLNMYKISPYIQYFCGEDYFKIKKPCSNAMLSVFRSRIGEEGCKYIFQESVRVHGEKALEEDVVVDSTVQPKNITYPTPTKLLAKVLGYCYYYANKLNISLSDTYRDSTKPLLRTLRFEKSNKKAGEVRKAKNKLRTIVNQALKSFEKKLPDNQKILMRKELESYHQIIKQTEPKTVYRIEQNAKKSVQIFAKIIGLCCKFSKDFDIEINNKSKQKFIEHVNNIKNKKGKGKKKYIIQEIARISKIAGNLLDTVDKNINEEQKNKILEKLTALHKIYDDQINANKNLCSIHEPSVACIAKGKDGKKYEFGSKASIVMTKTTGIIIGVKDFQGNPFDGKTLKPSLDMASETVGKMPKNVFTDRGYRGAQKDLDETMHHVPEAPKSNATELDKEEARKNFGRRSAIEPVISHVKSDFRLARNFLKGTIGDTINLLLSAAAFNLQKWCNNLPQEQAE